MISLNTKKKSRNTIVGPTDWNKSANDFILSKNVIKGEKVMQTISYTIGMNGWQNRMIIRTDLKAIGTDFKVKFEVFGVTEELDGRIDFDKGKLVPNVPIIVEPYENPRGKMKEFKEFNIPKFQLLQIKEYVSDIRYKF